MIDKDLAAELLAEQVGADVLLILTEVEKVAIRFGKPDQENLGHMSLAEAARYVEEGHFAPGSMLPKWKQPCALSGPPGEEGHHYQSGQGIGSAGRKNRMPHLCIK